MTAHGREAECRKQDLLGRRARWLLWGVPAVLFVAGAAWDGARAWLWVPSLAVAGLACLANASRCGRLHCFLTGPVFLLGALATLLDHMGFLSIDWRWIAAALVAGLTVGYGIEWMRGEYTGGRSAGEESNSCPK